MASLSTHLRLNCGRDESETAHALTGHFLGVLALDLAGYATQLAENPRHSLPENHLRGLRL